MSGHLLFLLSLLVISASGAPPRRSQRVQQILLLLKKMKGFGGRVGMVGAPADVGRLHGLQQGWGHVRVIKDQHVGNGPYKNEQRLSHIKDFPQPGVSPGWNKS